MIELSGGMHTFDVYLVSGEMVYKYNSKYEDGWMGTLTDSVEKNIKAYNKWYNITLKYLQNRPDLPGTTEAANSIYKIIFGDNPPADMSYRRWYPMFSHAWHVAHGSEPRISKARNQMIVQFSDVELDDGRYVWEGLNSDIWNHPSTIPGKIARLGVITDEYEKKHVILDIMVFTTLTDDPSQFASWLGYNIDNRGGGDYWIPKTA